MLLRDHAQYVAGPRQSTLTRADNDGHERCLSPHSFNDVGDDNVLVDDGEMAIDDIGQQYTGVRTFKPTPNTGIDPDDTHDAITVGYGNMTKASLRRVLV